MIKINFLLFTLVVASMQVMPGANQKPLADPTAQGSQGSSRSGTWEKPEDESHRKDSGCRSGKLDTTWTIENPPVEIQQNRIQLTETGTSFADFYVRNLQPLSMRAMAVVIEYSDNKGQVLERIPVVAAANAEQATQAFHPPFPFEKTYNRWKTLLLPGDSARVQGQSDGVIAAACPTGARVTFVMIQFADGSIKTLASPGWQLDPTPRVIPLVPQFPPDLVRPPVAILGRIMINAFGQVTDVAAVDQEEPAVLKLIQDQMRQNWQFNPALYNGIPSMSEITALFRIHSERTLTFPETRPLPSPIILIELFPDDANPGKLEIAYGRLLSGSGVE